MTISYKHLFILAAVLLVGVVAGSVLFQANKSLGSVVQGQEYTATTTTSTDANKHLQAKFATPCAVGSVVVASSSATTFTLWNATSTTDVSSTTIATFKASIAEGTYTLDATCSRGLIISTPSGFNGLYVTTYR